MIRTPVLVGLCRVAMRTASPLLHAVFVAGALIYQVAWISRLFDSLQWRAAVRYRVGTAALTKTQARHLQTRCQDIKTRGKSVDPS